MNNRKVLTARGDWAIEEFEVTPSEERMQELRAALNPQRPRRVVPAGTYRALTRSGGIVMTNTPDEASDHREFVARADGKVLVGGLGLGLIVRDLLENDKVFHVTVVELEADVIALVGPDLLRDYRPWLTLVHADLFTWTPADEVQYDSAWFDIWDNLCQDNRRDFRSLKKRYRRWVTGRIACWGEDYLRACR